MSVPDNLVQVAIDAGNEAIGEYANGEQFPDGIHAEVCRRAVTAAFAALPECEEARRLADRMCLHFSRGPCSGCRRDAQRILTALAQEFGAKP